MALISTGSKADTIAHGGLVSDASGSKGMMRVRTGGKIEYHDGSKWIADLSLPAFGNGTFNFTAGTATKVTKTGDTPSANLATSKTSTTTFSIDKTVTDGWLANKPPSGTIGWVDMAISCNPRNLTISSKTGYTAIAKLTRDGEEVYEYSHGSVGGTNKWTIGASNSAPAAKDPYKTYYSATQHTAHYTNEDGSTRHPVQASYFLAIL